MSGPYRYRERLSGLMTSIDPYPVGADSISARGSMRQRKPRGGVKTAWRRTTSAASQQSWPAHAVVCPAGANIVRSPVSLRSTVVPRLQPRTSLRFVVHGCHVGSGLDRSGNLPSGSPFPGAAHVGAAYMRPAGVRKNGCSRSGPRAGHARPLPIQGTAFRVDGEHRHLYRRGGFHIRPWEYAAAQTPRRGQDRLAAHNERRQPAKLARSCGCLPRRGKHCSLPGFATLNRGPTLTTPHLPTIRRSRVPCRERS